MAQKKKAKTGHGGRMSVPLDRAIKRRIAAGDQRGSFAGLLGPMLDLLDLLEKTKDEAVAVEGRRALCVRFVALFEGHLRDWIAPLVDDLLKVGVLDLSASGGISNQKFSIADIAHISGEKVSVGEIVAATVDLRDPRKCLDFLGSVTGQPVWQMIRGWSPPDEFIPEWGGDILEERIQTLALCTEWRHHCAHHGSPTIAPTPKQMTDALDAIMDLSDAIVATMREAWARAVEGHSPLRAATIRKRVDGAFPDL